MRFYVDPPRVSAVGGSQTGGLTLKTSENPEFNQVRRDWCGITVPQCLSVQSPVVNAQTQFTIFFWCKQDGGCIQTNAFANYTRIKQCFDLSLQFRPVLWCYGIVAHSDRPGVRRLRDIHVQLTWRWHPWHCSCLETVLSKPPSSVRISFTCPRGRCASWMRTSEVTKSKERSGLMDNPGM